MWNLNIQYLQYRFGWPNETTEIIAWKFLSLAIIQQINRDVLITKVYNDLLPTADTLCKMRYQNHDTCILCHQHETRDHIIRCTAPLRIKWRQQYIGALRKRLETIETEFALGETLSTSIAEWLKTEEVYVSNYPIKYANAILSQEQTGWQHIFAGNISKEWLELQADSTNKTVGKERYCYVWGASIVKITLKYFIKLWKQRNEEVHGKIQSSKTPQEKQS
jgi:predicted ATPase